MLLSTCSVGGQTKATFVEIDLLVACLHHRTSSITTIRRNSQHIRRFTRGTIWRRLDRGVCWQRRTPCVPSGPHKSTPVEKMRIMWSREFIERIATTRIVTLIGLFYCKPMGIRWLDEWNLKPGILYKQDLGEREKYCLPIKLLFLDMITELSSFIDSSEPYHSNTLEISSNSKN